MSTKSGIYIGEVISIDDPDKLGRSQVRIHGIHDDIVGIPDSDLLWAIPLKGSDDPAINKMGTGGNGLVKGTKVMIHFWDTGGQQSAFIMGSVPKAGDTTSGSITNGQATIDNTKSSTPTASRGNDINPVVSNKIQSANTTPGSNSDVGQNIYKDIAQASAKLATLPTIGSATQVATGDVIALIKTIDPNNTSGSIPNAMNAIHQLLAIENSLSTNGQNNLAGQILGNVLGNVAKSIGASNVNSLLNSIFSSSNNTSNGSYQFSSDSNILIIVQTALLQYGLTLSSAETLLSSSDSNTTTMVTNLTATLQTQLSPYISGGTLTKQLLLQIIESLLAQVQQQTQQNSIGGSGSSLLSNITSLLPTIGSLIQNTISKQLPNSVLNQQSIQNSLQKYAKSHAVLNNKDTLIKEIFTVANSLLNSKLSTVSSLKGLINPATGNTL